MHMACMRDSCRKDEEVLVETILKPCAKVGIQNAHVAF